MRHIHFVLNGAYSRGVRWRWVSVNPVEFVDPPAKPPPDPDPPTSEQAARIINEAFREPDCGALVWLTMTTGCRRGELCAPRWSHVDLDPGTLMLRRAISQDGRIREEKDTKTHQQRRIVLDPETVAILRDHREGCEERARALGVELAADAFVFSLEPDGSSHLVPSSVTQRYGRMAASAVGRSIAVEQRRSDAEKALGHESLKELAQESVERTDRERRSLDAVEANLNEVLATAWAIDYRRAQSIEESIRARRRRTEERDLRGRLTGGFGVEDPAESDRQADRSAGLVAEVETVSNLLAVSDRMLRDTKPEV